MYKKNKILIQIMILLGLVSLASAQIKSISGTIRNALTLEPLPYANLVIKGTYLGGTSNVDGYYYLSGLNHDSVQVVCTYIGYNTISKKLYFENETHIVIPISMNPHTLGGEEVLVEDTLLVIPEIRIATQIPGPEMPKNMELKSSEVLEDAGYSYELSAPIRWLHPTGEFTRYILDGVPVENSRHLYNVYPTFNLDAVKHIENHPAGNIKQTSTDQVNATELIYKEGNRSETDVRAILGLVESGLTTSGPHAGGGSWYFSARRVDFDALYSLNTAQADSVYRQFAPDYYFYDLNGKVTFDVSDDTKISGNMYLTFDKLHWLGDNGRSAHSSWYNGFISSRIQHRFTPRLLSQTNLYRKTYHSFLRAANIPEGRSTNLDGDFINSLTTFGLSSQADYFLGGNNMVSFGLSTERLQSELVFVDSSKSGEKNGWIIKAKGGYRYTLPYNLAADIGLQYILSTFADKSVLNPSFLINWEPSNIYRLYFSMVQSSPLILETSMSNTLTQPLFDILVPIDTSAGSPIPEILNISVGGSMMPIIGYDLSAEIFSDILSTPILMDSSWQGDFSRQEKWLMAYDKGRVSGLKFAFEKRSSGIRSLLQYRFSRAKYTDIQGTEALMPGHREHEFYFILDGDYEEKMGYRLDFTLASGKRYLSNDVSWDWSSPYHRIDVSFYRDISWGGVGGQASIRLINLTNNSISEQEYGDSSWVVNSLQDRAFVLLPFTPTLNVEFSF
ncbi:MAG: carboxypeptidase-like regulatory domain-containing protein [Candidatus Marinimicrobia bacterium]|nr:carboxypeptidase-like regulatory domain-containing protein [Candidatus Neomarinimicrobiota bacterium]